jgi:hypothetical protein
LRQNSAAWNFNCRRLTSVHEAHRQYLYRLSIARHVATYYLTQLRQTPNEPSTLVKTAARILAGSGPWFLSCLNCRQLLQKLEDQLGLLVGLRQHRDTRLFQHLRLRQVGRFRCEVGILNGAARLREVLSR